MLTSKRQFPIINAKGKLVQFNSFHETNYLDEIKIEIEQLRGVKIVWSYLSVAKDYHVMTREISLWLKTVISFQHTESYRHFHLRKIA